ncbi:hypothetical protein [Metabacillus rhizolycopersici]|uniref:Major facilitator superfamily (MFS) profile domain-containing protein n=1 Tax=Metabacillus rhizolycopersici TaxID=2875709 RepID=A0ABS7UW07_9BACI|nr:hypothetical protein [Metabacillus rhizolycopersici]MBZ5752109.1 hypothetical protein [Metabacillus rhizolycopersici]
MVMELTTSLTVITPALGPTFGKIIASTLNWRYIFIFLLPILMISFIAGSFSIEQGKPVEKVKFDDTSVIFIMITFVGIVYGFSRAGELGWTSIVNSYP